MSLEHNLVLFAAAALGGAVNSVAGGGTLLTFPALLWVGHANPALMWGDQVEKIANATSTVALWPGQLSSLWGYRKEIGESRTAILRLGVPSLIGGVIGAMLLLYTPPKIFAHLVPFLILMATLLFMTQESLSRWLRARAARAEQKAETIPDPTPTPHEMLPARAWAGIIGFQFLVAIYGGYFGAGIGILMLAALGFMGFTNIHRMNGLKNINGLCINAVAALIFVVRGLVDWRIAGLMAAGAIVGGYGGAGTARRIGQRTVRRIIICIGFALTLSLLLQRH
jgi:uncharacterized membrane protein YfcA